jgi:hypothetical protein
MVLAKISSVREYLTAVTEVIDDWRQTILSGWPLTFWYRGVASRSKHLLVPGRYRDAFVNMRHEEEAAMLMEFKRTAPALHPGPLPISARHTAWMTIGQHHGLPTRLLDWAESSLVGLYFAVTSARQKDDPAEPAVWMLNPDALNRRISPRGFIPVIVGHAQDRKLVDKPWGLLTGKLAAAEPIAVRTVAITARVSAQHGVFTLFGTDKDGLETLKGHSSILRCLDIDPNAVDQIQDELRQAGVTAATIFPDLDGLCRSIKSLWKLRTRALQAGRSSP